MSVRICIGIVGNKKIVLVTHLQDKNHSRSQNSELHAQRGSRKERRDAKKDVFQISIQYFYLRQQVDKVRLSLYVGDERGKYSRRL